MNGQECRIRTIDVGGEPVYRLTYPPNLDWMTVDEFPETCHDCGVRKGGVHHKFCDMEECPAGCGQLLMCEHGPMFRH